MSRKYPERTRKPERPLSISTEYMRREAGKWHMPVEDWVMGYLKRNTIGYRHHTHPEYGEYLLIDFPSCWRAEVFVNRARREFPYFEFL